MFRVFLRSQESASSIVRKTMSNPFDEFPMSDRPDACRWETGHPSSLLLYLYSVYSYDIFDDLDPPLTNLNPGGVATMNHLHFFLLYKYIHVSGQWWCLWAWFIEILIGCVCIYFFYVDASEKAHIWNYNDGEWNAQRRDIWLLQVSCSSHGTTICTRDWRNRLGAEIGGNCVIATRSCCLFFIYDVLTNTLHLWRSGITIMNTSRAVRPSLSTLSPSGYVFQQTGLLRGCFGNQSNWIDLYVQGRPLNFTVVIFGLTGIKTAFSRCGASYSSFDV